MSTRAYLLVETAVSKARDVVNTIYAIGDMVESVDVITGPYDVIVVVEGRDLIAIGKFVTEQIHTINGVTRTVTCVVVPNHDTRKPTAIAGKQQT